MIETLCGLHNFILRKEGSKSMTDFDAEMEDRAQKLAADIANPQKKERNVYDSENDYFGDDEGEQQNMATNEFLFNKYYGS